MRKPSLCMDPAVDRALDLRAAAEGVTKAEFVRRVLAAVVSGRPRARGVLEGPRRRGGAPPLRGGIRRGMIAPDTPVAVAFMNRRDGDHEQVAAWMETVEEDLLTTPQIVIGVDHPVPRGGGPDAARAFYEDLRSGACLVEWWPEAVADNADIGLADASLLALAARLQTALVATPDERRFRAARPPTGEAALTLLPADA